VTAAKDELIAVLRSSGDDALRTLRALPEQAYEQGRYESGWNARQILAHVASIEWTYPRLIDVAKQSAGAGTEQTAVGKEEKPPTRPFQGGNDSPGCRRSISRSRGRGADARARRRAGRALRRCASLDDERAIAA
jgi:hypothetical protein